MIVEWEGRKIDIELENATADYDYWSDCFIQSAHYDDNGEEVSDYVVDQMQDSDLMCGWIIDYLN